MNSTTIRAVSLNLLLTFLASCATGPSNNDNAGTPRGSANEGPPIPTARELAQDPAWISCSIKAKWVYLENAPEGYRSADWIPLLPTYTYDPGSHWLEQQPMRRFADGPGQLTLRKQPLSFSNVFKADNSVLEVTGDWKNGRLVKAYKIRGAGELAKQEYNWAAIGAGFGAAAVGFAPFVWTGKKLVEAIKEGGSSDSVTVLFKGTGMFWMQSARVFNVDASGHETSLPSPYSPGHASDGQSKGPKDNTSWMQVSLFPGDGKAVAGRYGFKASWTHVSNPDLLGQFRDVDAEAKLEGTFEITPGTKEVWITYDKYSPNKVKVQLLK